jgi:hypothetical protein
MWYRCSAYREILGAVDEEEPALVQLRSDFLATYGDRYSIRRTLGEGASGRAYLANDHRRRVDVCIKLYHEGIPAKGSDRDWHITSTLKHRAVADTFTVEEFSSTQRRCLAVVSRFIRGHSLMRVLQQIEATPLERQVELSIAFLDSVIEDLCEGLSACHDAGFGHGDLHARNVIICQREHRLGAVIIDFDNATIASSSCDEKSRCASDVRSLRYLIGQIAQGWKWHELLLSLVDHHQSIGALRGALGWALAFLKTADGRTGSKTDVKALRSALYHHSHIRPEAWEHADAVLNAVESVAADLGLNAELADAKQSWQRLNRNQFTFYLPPRDPAEPVLVDPPLADLWNPLGEE